MSLSALFAANGVIASNKHEEHPRVIQTELNAPQARLATQDATEGFGMKHGLFNQETFKSTSIGQNWSKPDPVRNPTNDIAYAMNLQFVGRPAMFNQPRIVGNDKSHLQAIRMKNLSQRPANLHLTELDPSLVQKNAAPAPPKHVAYSTAM